MSFEKIESALLILCKYYSPAAACRRKATTAAPSPSTTRSAVAFFCLGVLASGPRRRLRQLCALIGAARLTIMQQTHELLLS